MRNLFAVPWLTPRPRTLLSFVVVGTLVLSIFALLKTSSGGKQGPAKELLTGSIQRPPAVRKSPSNDPMAAFLTPTSTQPTPQPIQRTVVDRGGVPLPRPRPKRLWWGLQKPSNVRITALCFKPTIDKRREVLAPMSDWRPDDMPPETFGSLPAHRFTFR